jgi:hypothetical protein
MKILTRQQQADRRCLRDAESKLKSAQARLKRTSCHRSRILADIKHERTRAQQPHFDREKNPKSEI